MSENKKIIIATGVDEIDNALSNLTNYETLAIIKSKKELNEACSFLKPDILLTSENILGKESIVSFLLPLKKNYPEIRIVFISTALDINDKEKINELGLLTLSGIYDILYEDKVNTKMIVDLLDNPNNEKSGSVEFLIQKMNKGKRKEEKLINFDDNSQLVDEYQDSGVYRNLYTISSIKPGTGKSFIATNVATAIAEYGIKNLYGEKVKVAIIEADLQNLSVGTLLQIEENDKNNLKAVMDKIATIIDKNGELCDDIFKINEVNEFILNSFTSYSQCKNLKALVGSKLSFQQIESVGEQYAYYYSYLISVIEDSFDVIIVDSNSALTHVTTQPLLYQSKFIYYILNLDYNNVRNNVRYKDEFIELGIEDRIKYILNEDVVDDYEGESLMFSSKEIDTKQFNIVAKVPELPKTIFLNRLYAGIPVVLDKSKVTEKARYEILKVANEIWEIQGFNKVVNDKELINNVKEKKKTGKFFGFGRR